MHLSRSVGRITSVHRNPGYLLLQMMEKLTIAICGAGIAGLAAASALAPNHHVFVFERKRDLQEVSYAINLKPNAAKAAFGVIGLSPKTIKGNPCVEIVERNARDGEIKMKKLVDAPNDFGGPWYFCQRTELHSELLRSAKNRGAVVEVGKEVIHVQPGDSLNQAIIIFQNGTKFTVDLCLGKFFVFRWHNFHYVNSCRWIELKIAQRCPS